MTKLPSLQPRLRIAKADSARVADATWRSGKSSTQRGYGYKWQQYRLRFLKMNPLCVYCERDNRVTVATVVDHIVPHEGDKRLFWDTKNHQSLCASCHSSIKQREEKSIGGGIKKF